MRRGYAFTILIPSFAPSVLELLPSKTFGLLMLGSANRRTLRQSFFGGPFMKNCYLLALALLLLVISPVAAADIAKDEKTGKIIEVINDV